MDGVIPCPVHHCDGTCCSFTTPEVFSRRWSEVGSCFIPTVSKAAIAKAQQYVLSPWKHTLVRQSRQRMLWSLRASHNGVLLPLIPCQAHFTSNRVSCWDCLATPETEMVPAPVQQCLLEPLALLCKVFQSTQSTKPSCFFPPPGWSQAPPVLTVVSSSRPLSLGGTLRCLSVSGGGQQGW